MAVLEVAEFAEAPHFCAKDYDTTLQRGALYVRSRTVPETTAVASPEEMRELIDLATEKRLRAYVRTAERAGVRLTTDGVQSDEDRYRAQRHQGFK